MRHVRTSANKGLSLRRLRRLPVNCSAPKSACRASCSAPKSACRASCSLIQAFMSAGIKLSTWRAKITRVWAVVKMQCALHPLHWEQRTYGFRTSLLTHGARPSLLTCGLCRCSQHVCAAHDSVLALAVRTYRRPLTSCAVICRRLHATPVTKRSCG